MELKLANKYIFANNIDFVSFFVMALVITYSTVSIEHTFF